MSDWQCVETKAVQRHARTWRPETMVTRTPSGTLRPTAERRHSLGPGTAASIKKQWKLRKCEEGCWSTAPHSTATIRGQPGPCLAPAAPFRASLARGPHAASTGWLWVALPLTFAGIFGLATRRAHFWQMHPPMGCVAALRTTVSPLAACPGHPLFHSPPA